MRALIFLVLLACSQAFGYSPPLGIPNPATYFGWEIDRPTPDWPTEWTQPVKTYKVNYYYVDKTQPNANNANGNGYGYPGAPRATIPETTFAAGSFVYVEAGTYDGGDNTGDRWDWNGVGTSQNPIWITGNPTTKPILEGYVNLASGGNTSYLIFENFEIGGDFVNHTAHLEIHPNAVGQSCDHILVRNCILTGTQHASDPGGITIGISQSSDPDPNATYTYTVIYNNVVSNFGNKVTSDDGGILIGYHTDYTWVLDNVVHDVASDSVAGSHYSNYTTKLSEHYFIGRNTCYSNGENGIDIKNTRYVVVSENTIYGPFTREQGWAMVFHYGALTQFHDRDVWVIYNTIYHCSGGIYTSTSSGADNLNVYGNLLYDIRASYAAQPDSFLNGYCVFIGGGDGTFRVAQNTFYDYDGGIKLNGLDGSDSVKIHGNIFGSRADPNGYEIQMLTNGQEAFVTSSDYNRFPASSRFFWANAARNFSYMQNTASKEAHSSEGDPGFNNVAMLDFSITNASACKNVSVIGPVGDTANAAFQAMFGLSLNFEFRGLARPTDAWDIGAFEYGTGRVRVGGDMTVGTAVLP